MKAVLFVIACLIAAAVAAPLSDNQYQFLFTKFIEQYNKQYEINDFFTKFNTFKSNLDLIVAHNAKESSYKMGVNQFADFTVEEFEQMMGLNTKQQAPFALSQLEQEFNPTTFQSIPNETIDYRSQLNPPKNQASCGSCWAFSSVGAVEHAYHKAGGKLYDLSEQQLVDCAGSYGNSGCNGGLMTNAFEYLIKKGGSCLQKDYTYTAKENTCKTTCKPVVQVSSYQTVATSRDAHLAALRKQSVAVALAASSQAFQFYKSGVVDNCTDQQVNHAVLLVGYGSQGGHDYWLIRNSWGTSWGENGYIKLSTTPTAKGPQCGLTTSKFDSVPVVKA